MDQMWISSKAPHFFSAFVDIFEKIKHFAVTSLGDDVAWTPIFGTSFRSVRIIKFIVM